jgi:hypothetical protein
MILCIASDHLLQESSERVLFNEEGKIAPDVANFVEFLKQCEKDRLLTAHATRALVNADVIKPWSLSIKTSEDSDAVPVKGFYRVCEDSLATLSAELLAKLRDSGALKLAYAQLFSMARLDQIMKRARYHASEQMQAVTRVRPYDDIFKEEESFNFEFLNR